MLKAALIPTALIILPQSFPRLPLVTIAGSVIITINQNYVPRRTNVFEVRMNLSDVIGNEDDVFEYLNMVFEKHQFSKVKFWCNGELDESQLDSFMKRSRKALHNDIKIQMATRQPKAEFAWFDIIPDAHAAGAQNRFSYAYKNATDIIPGIINFYTMMEHISSNSQKKKYYNKDK